MNLVDRYYFVPLNISPLAQCRLDSLLSADEQNRLKAIKVQHLRTRYVAAHGFLRAIVAKEAGVPPTTADIRSDRFGRPALFIEAVQCTFDFNMSHSENWMMIGLSHRARIGVDVELWRKLPYATDQLSNILSPEEIDIVHDVLKSSTCRASSVALRLWTLKEATLKAHGSGLHIEPRRVHLDLAELSCLLRSGSVDPAPTVTSQLEGIDTLWSVSCLPFPLGSAAVARPKSGQCQVPLVHQRIEAAELLRMAELP